MAMMNEPVGGLSEFISILGALERGERDRFPFYCALLYTVSEGPDAGVARYVDEHWDELDAMTGDHCLVFVIGDVRDEPAAEHRPFKPHEVYAVAEHLGVRQDALPCAVFFADPTRTHVVLRVRLADFVAADGETISAAALTRGFRGVASATDRCADHPSQTDRLDCLRERLIDAHQRFTGDGGSSKRERLEDAASTAGAVEKVLTSGVTIAATLLGVLGLG